MTDRSRLRDKLCRELSQAEHSAIVHLARDAERLGDIPPASALIALSEHARAVQPRFEAAAHLESSIGHRLGEAVGELFSLTRHLFADRIIDNERSYRGDLLGVRHGVDAAQLLLQVALLERDTALIDFLNEWLPARTTLVATATAQLAWFAEHADFAIR